MLRRLLHCMLALALAFAGAGNAAASVSMLVMPAAPSADAHAMHDAAGDPQPRHAGANEPGDHADCGSACCKDASTCHCPDAQLAQDIALPAALPKPHKAGIAAVSEPAYGHPAPSLRDDIRPPIGQA